MHKLGIPLRPIVNSKDGPVYDLSKYLLAIISPLRGKTKSYMKSSVQFVSIENRFTTSLHYLKALV